MSTGFRLARDLARRLASLVARVRWRGANGSSTGYGGAPNHWVEYVRARAPHLLAPGGMESARVSPRIAEVPAAPPSPFPQATAAPTAKRGTPAGPSGEGGRRESPPRLYLQMSPQAQSRPSRPVQSQSGQRPVQPGVRAPRDEPDAPPRPRFPRPWPSRARRRRREVPLAPPVAPADSPATPPAAEVGRLYGPARLDVRTEPARRSSGSGRAHFPEPGLIAGVTMPAQPAFEDRMRPRVVDTFAGRPEPIHASRVGIEARYAEPFNPWPPLPEPIAGERDWRHARDAAEAELRLQHEQERL
ncbi:MAG TPA: hypothetical protein VJT78_12700 [Candidatus Dormibacteraeota bacterium]|nr:hypothetical protein [Candidatus Dormibacteraeota bacterium]